MPKLDQETMDNFCAEIKIAVRRGTANKIGYNSIGLIQRAAQLMFAATMESSDASLECEYWENPSQWNTLFWNVRKEDFGLVVIADKDWLDKRVVDGIRSAILANNIPWNNRWLRRLPTDFFDGVLDQIKHLCDQPSESWKIEKLVEGIQSVCEDFREYLRKSLCNLQKENASVSLAQIKYVFVRYRFACLEDRKLAVQAYLKDKHNSADERTIAEDNQTFAEYDIISTQLDLFYGTECANHWSDFENHLITEFPNREYKSVIQGAPDNKRDLKTAVSNSGLVHGWFDEENQVFTQPIIGLYSEFDKVPRKLKYNASYACKLGHLTNPMIEELALMVTGNRGVASFTEKQLMEITPEFLDRASLKCNLETKSLGGGNQFIVCLQEILNIEVEPTVEPERMLTEEESDAILDGIIGADEALKWARDLRDDIRDYRDGVIKWEEMDPGLLLVGPPGTGKTTFVEKIAKALNVKVTVGSYAIWGGGEKKGYLNDYINGIIKTFKDASENAKKDGVAFVVLDEFDQVSKRSGGDHRRDGGAWWDALQGQLLKSLESQAHQGVIVIGITNHPEAIDPGLRRAGRLDRQIEIGLPTPAEFSRILAQHLGTGLDLETICLSCVGLTGAVAQQMSRDVKRIARKGRREVTIEDIKTVVRGKGMDNASPETIRRIAVHEAGHAIMCGAVAGQSYQITGITIRKDGQYKGSMDMKELARNSWTLDSIERNMMILLAGRAAEEVVFGPDNVSACTGDMISNDLALASMVAVQLELTCGFGKLTTVTISNQEATALLLQDRHLAEAVEKRLSRLYANTMAILRAKRHVLDRIAGHLVEHDEVMTKPELERILIESEMQSVLLTADTGRAN